MKGSLLVSSHASYVLAGVSSHRFQNGLLPCWKLCKKPGTLRNRFENRISLSVFNYDLDIAEVIPRFFGKDEFEVVGLFRATKCFEFFQTNPATQIRNPVVCFC